MIDQRGRQRVDAARSLVLWVLMLNVATAVALPLLLVDPAGATAVVLLGLALAVHAALHVLTLRGAVSPWLEERSRWLLAGSLAAATAVSAIPLYLWAEPAEEPWAWLAGATSGSLLILLRPTQAAGAVLALLLFGVGCAMSWGADVANTVGFLLLASVSTGLFSAVVVWMLRLLVAVEAGREAQARLAVAEERLRLSRDIHDVLGHQLGVIALRAELSGVDEIRDLATSTLKEVRRAVHAEGTVDLGEQVRNAALVLQSAGIHVDVDVAPAPLPAPLSQLMASGVREGVTNLLRHSDATTCRISLTRDAGTIRLTMSNDGASVSDQVDAGMGLVGLAERAASVGATVRWQTRGSHFLLTVEAAT